MVRPLQSYNLQLVKQDITGKPSTPPFVLASPSLGEVILIKCEVSVEFKFNGYILIEDFYLCLVSSHPIHEKALPAATPFQKCQGIRPHLDVLKRERRDVS